MTSIKRFVIAAQDCEAKFLYCSRLFGLSDLAEAGTQCIGMSFARNPFNSEGGPTCFSESTAQAIDTDTLKAVTMAQSVSRLIGAFMGPLIFSCGIVADYRP